MPIPFSPFSVARKVADAELLSPPLVIKDRSARRTRKGQLVNFVTAIKMFDTFSGEAWEVVCPDGNRWLIK